MQENEVLKEVIKEIVSVEDFKNYFGGKKYISEEEYQTYINYRRNKQQF